MGTLCSHCRTISAHPRQLHKHVRAHRLQKHAARFRNARAAPLAHGLRAHAAQTANGHRPAERVDDVAVRWLNDKHAHSVSALTMHPQVVLQARAHDGPVSRELMTEAQRVTWAKEHSGRTWQQLGEAVGCSHSALVLWGKGQTALTNAKVHLVLAFAKATGVNVQWLLTGDGPAITAYPRHEHPVVEQARALVEERPALADTGYQLLRTLAQAPGAPNGN